jgi:hypothetical protein
MANKHGGARAGAGRPRASKNRLKPVTPTEPSDPLSVALRAMHALEASGDLVGAARIATRLAPYFAPRLPLTAQPVVPHPAQPLLPIFNDPASSSAVGKKERAAIAAQSAGEGTDWGDDLASDAKPN